MTKEQWKTATGFFKKNKMTVDAAIMAPIGHRDGFALSNWQRMRAGWPAYWGAAQHGTTLVGLP